MTSGTFSLDGQTFDVENNVWVAGDDTECVVLDAPHDVAAILDVIDGRRVLAIVATHAHDDHVRAAPELAAATGAPVLLHPADLPLWRLTHPGTSPGGELADGQEIAVGGTVLRVLHTPGHSPGSCCLHDAALGVVRGLTIEQVQERSGGDLRAPTISRWETSERSIRQPTCGCDGHLRHPGAASGRRC